MLTKKALLAYIQGFLNDISKNIHIRKVILFGSYANGFPKKYSDIDLAIVSDDFTENPIHNHRLIIDAAIKYHKIEVHLFDTKYFVEGDPFIEEIIKTGIELKLEGDTFPKRSIHTVNTAKIFVKLVRSNMQKT